jgi:hypothetical protein
MAENSAPKTQKRALAETLSFSYQKDVEKLGICVRHSDTIPVT